MALEEDIGEGDVTSAYFIPEDRMARAFLTVRRDGVVSGVAIAKQVFAEVDPDLDVQVLVEDGSKVSEGAMLMKVEGKARSIHRGADGFEFYAAALGSCDLDLALCR